MNQRCKGFPVEIGENNLLQLAKDRSVLSQDLVFHWEGRLQEHTEILHLILQGECNPAKTRQTATKSISVPLNNTTPVLSGSNFNLLVLIHNCSQAVLQGLYSYHSWAGEDHGWEGEGIEVCIISILMTVNSEYPDDLSQWPHKDVKQHGGDERI